MVRPHRFRPNPETARDNAFQRAPDAPADAVAARAQAEHDAAVQALREAGVTVHLFEDNGHADTPDAVFPNNWFSCHADGTVVLYPMRCENRRRERRDDVLALLRSRYRMRRVLDYRAEERAGRYLEGTGALVFDPAQRGVYGPLGARPRAAAAAPGRRAGPAAAGLRRPRPGRATGLSHQRADVAGPPLRAGRAGLGGGGRPRGAGRGPAARRPGADPAQRRAAAGLRRQCAGAGQPAGAAAGAVAPRRRLPGQRAELARHVRLLPLAVPTLELAGGSVRCMLAGVHLPPLATPAPP